MDGNLNEITGVTNMQDFIRKAAEVRPSERQLKWQEMEFYAFIHFSINTFTDREWGTGDEVPSLFNPTGLDAGQWVDVCKSGGMKGIILTCKHHDGFCLWPSRYTAHNTKNSPWRSGRGDLVREVSEACRKGGLKFGIYLSPWDRHEASYGDSDRYNDFFANQLRELLTGYGEIFSVWFDGACGEGPNGKRQIYDWNRWYGIIRELQPNAVISVCGPDVRWCGNEAGHCRESEWSVVPEYLQDAEKTAKKSQQQDDREFSRRIDSANEDLGSRKVIENAGRLVWYPAEVNTSIRPGWFYHASEDELVKPVDELLSIYYKSVGGNANFLLNIPPDKRGLIHENDAECLRKLGQVLQDSFSEDLAANAAVKASISMLEIDLGDLRDFNRIVLMEDIRNSGQLVESFVLEVPDNDGWKEIFKGTVIGYKKICCFSVVTAKKIRLNIIQSRGKTSIKYSGVFLSVYSDAPFHHY